MDNNTTPLNITCDASDFAVGGVLQQYIDNVWQPLSFFSKIVRRNTQDPLAEMIYGTTLRLPGEFTQKYTIDAHTNLDNYSDMLRVAMSRLRLCPPCDTHQKNIFQYKEIDTCTHVFLRRIAIAPPLTAPYDGPYKVIVRSGRVMKILIKSKVETVSLGRVKPVHFECEPATGTTTQRTTPSKRTSSKTTGIVRRNTQDPLAPSSTHTQRSNRKRLNMVQIWPLLHSKKL